ncbi:MAG TPA: UTP--glucose-1-phosphate uridylyltransferase [Candidatus Paceibacterota bacterium]
MPTNRKIRKAIIPAAGFGTRFLPATKAQPKEMLPVVDKPIIQYVVEDAVAAGIEDIIIVTGSLKRSIEDHFDYPYELERRLEASGKTAELDEIRKIADLANFYFVRQKGPVGSATAIWNARAVIGDEPFLVLWGDEFMDATPTRSQQLVKAFAESDAGVMLASVTRNRRRDYDRYGYATGKEIKPGLLDVKEIVEKPGMGNIDSDYAIIGGSVYEPEMFNAIEEAMKHHDPSNGRELIYIDAIKILLERGKRCEALKILNGEFYDCGSKLEYLKAVVTFGLRHEDLREDFEAYIKSLTK